MTVEWIIYMAALPVFVLDLFYYPGWIIGLLGFIFYSYLLVEVGLLKAFYGFRNPRIAQERLAVKKSNSSAIAVDSESSEGTYSINER